jgi:mono/diheme cytochrome c family protein
MKILKTVIVIVFLAIGGWFLTSHAANAANGKSLSANEENQKNSARDLYVRNCARCHGADGKGDTPKGRELAVTDLTGSKVQRMSRAKIATIIRNGEDEMPGFGKTLSRAEINALANYVRGF